MKIQNKNKIEKQRKSYCNVKNGETFIFITRPKTLYLMCDMYKNHSFCVNIETGRVVDIWESDLQDTEVEIINTSVTIL